MTRAQLRLQIGAWVPLECDFSLTRPPEARFGEFSSNAPLVAARILRRGPLEIGQTLLEKLSSCWSGRIELSGGRLNFFMSETSFLEALERAAREGAHYGAGESLAGQRILVEFVSSDPTGPLPFSAGRQAAVGEAICRLLENQGARVTREFYLNDATTSSKAQLLGESVAFWYLRAFGQPAQASGAILDESFVRGVAAELARRDGAKWLHVEAGERVEACSHAALDAAIESQRNTLERFGVRFDSWVSEAQLRREGRLNEALERLKDADHTYESDGALWLRTSRFGDEADRVLLRAGGKPTYFAGDIAYHLWKDERGFDAVINLWSSEHRTYIERTKAALRAAGLAQERFEFLVCDGAILERDGTPLRLGIGGGNLILDEELEELDADALKFFFTRTPATKVVGVDLEVARRDDETNPAYQVQLLASRLGRLRREIEGQNRAGSPATTETPAWSEHEREVARLVALWPDEAHEAAQRREPQKVAQFLIELSRAVRALSAAPRLELTAETVKLRLDLLRGAQGVANSGLKMLGIEARERF